MDENNGRSGAPSSVRSVACGHCQRVNADDRKFCSSCGRPLWEKCLNCGSLCSTSEAFCGECGANLREAINKRLDRIQGVLAEAKELEDKHFLGDALRVLRSISLAEHSQLEEHVAQVKARIGQLEAKEAEQRTDLGVSVERVRELMAQHAYGDAIKLIEKLPPAMRNDETDELLNSARSIKKEIATLKAEITKAVAEKEFLDLSPKFTRILSLKPDSGSTIKVAERVRDWVVEAAQRQLGKYEYEKAQQLLAHVPDCVRNEEVEKLARQTGELNWIHRDLTYAPFVDPPLVAIAARMKEKVPGDRQSVLLFEKIERFAKKEPTNTRHPVVTWIRPPQTTFMGCDVAWLGGSERLRTTNADAAQVMRLHPGQLFVAAGLALQGLGMAQIETDLRPIEKKGLLGKLSKGRKKEVGSAAWGLDIGPSSLKVMKLVAPDTKERSAEEVAVEVCDVIPHGSFLNRPDVEADRSQLLRETLETFFEKHTIAKGDILCLSIPGHQVLGRFLTLPVAKKKKLHEMVQYEARQQIPIPLEDLSWSYQQLTAGDEEEMEFAQPKVLLVAAKMLFLRETMHIFQQLEREAHLIQSDCIALHNFALFEGLGAEASEDAEPGRTALVDIGTEATNIIVSDVDRLWFRSIRLGGDEFTEAAIRQLRVTHKQGEQVKHQPTKAKSVSELYNSYDPIFNRLVDELRRSFESFKKEHNETVSRILGVGGGFQLHGLLRYLRSGP